MRSSSKLKTVPSRRMQWLLLSVGAVSLLLGTALLLTKILETLSASAVSWPAGVVFTAVGGTLTLIGLNRLLQDAASSRSYTSNFSNLVPDLRSRTKDLRVVAIGGGTGLPATLRGLKPYTDHITAVVTVADDGGSSGRLRRDLQILPPGDLRNNLSLIHI